MAMDKYYLYRASIDSPAGSHRPPLQILSGFIRKLGVCLIDIIIKPTKEQRPVKQPIRRPGGFHPQRGFHRRRRFIPPARVDFVKKKHQISGRHLVFLFCERVTKRSKIEVRVSKSSVLIHSLQVALCTKQITFQTSC